MILNNLNKNIVILILFTTMTPSFSSYAGNDNQHNQESIFNHNNNPEVIAAVPTFFPPFYHQDNEGLPYGMAIEVLNEVAHAAGFVTKYVVKSNWEGVFKSIESGEAQLIPNLGITEERKKHFYFTKPYATTDITIFTRNDNIIKKASMLTNLNVGVVKKNIGTKIAKQRQLKHVFSYDSIDLAFKALIDKKIDALIYPKLITINAADRLNIEHLIYDTGISLKTIHRALAVSKKHKKLFVKIDAVLNQYLQSQEFNDTYIAWYGKENFYLSKTNLITINIFIFFLTVLVFNILWRKNNFSIFKHNPHNSKTIWLFTLISILITATTVVALSTLWIIYQTSLNEQKLRLIDNVKSRARLIEAIARYDKIDIHQHTHPISDPYTVTLNQIIDAHKNFKGFGDTGEFTLARKFNNEIQFLLRQRHALVETPQPIPFISNLEIPMQRALLGHSGAMVAKDYRGEDVLAAYEPVKIYNLGIVAKIDIAEIREPYIRSALIISGIVIVISLFGSLLFFYIIIPVVKNIQITEQRFHKLFQNNHFPIILADPENALIKDVNKAAIKFYGYTRKELLSFSLDFLSINSESKVITKLQYSINNNFKPVITKHQLQSGEIRDIEILISPIEADNETIMHCMMIDITEKIKKEYENIRLQKDLEQARKMEALGQLTGGIAHDFNNILGIIMGYTELSREKLTDDGNIKVNGYLEHVSTASVRAKELISSMMVFSRTDEGQYKSVNISPLVKEDIKMLRSIIPTSIDIVSNINENLPAILIEPVKLQQLLMNLCVNARDAMDALGTMTINLNWKKDIKDNCLICHEQIKGDWIQLSISDTGTGMTDEVVKHLFEPFFTTKEQGKGTGMGMAVVHGIVQDLKAHILIDTMLGKGTSINILFKPETNQIENITTDEKHEIIKEEHHQHILIIDDEKSMSIMLGDMLEPYGYQCNCIFSSEQALTTFSQNPELFDLIISDQTMPKITGLEMIKKMRIIRPDIPAIIATGYSDSIDENIAKENNITLLRKPLTKVILEEAINNIFSAQ